MKKLLIAAGLLAAPALLSFAPSPGYEVGDKARGFKLKNTDGKTVSADDFGDARGFIVIFTCNHCPFSVAYEDRIIALDRQFKSKGYPVIAINPNDENTEPEDSFEGMVQRAREKGFTFPYLYDQTQFYAREYGASRTPHVFVLQKQGKNLIVQYIGAVDDNTRDPQAVTRRYVEDAVNELLDGKKVTTPFTKAIGCTIKWRKS